MSKFFYIVVFCLFVWSYHLSSCFSSYPSWNPTTSPVHVPFPWLLGQLLILTTAASRFIYQIDLSLLEHRQQKLLPLSQKVNKKVFTSSVRIWIWTVRLLTFRTQCKTRLLLEICTISNAIGIFSFLFLPLHILVIVIVGSCDGITFKNRDTGNYYLYLIYCVHHLLHTNTGINVKKQEFKSTLCTRCFNELPSS